MEFVNLTPDLSIVRAHVELFAYLLFALPPVTFLSIKFWITLKTASKVQRSTQWFVPNELDSQETRTPSDRPIAAEFVTHQLHPIPLGGRH
jgi:hypothetical protein